MTKASIKVPACTTCNGICTGCWYTNQCNRYNDTGTAMATLSIEVPAFSLCAARHNIPVPSCIFSNTVNPLDTHELELHAMKKLVSYKKQHIAVYVTGLSVALVAVINACKNLNIKLTLMHYDKNNGEYYQQEVA